MDGLETVSLLFSFPDDMISSLMRTSTSQWPLFEEEFAKGATQRVFLPLFQPMLECMGEQVVESPYSLVVHELRNSDEEISLTHLDRYAD